MDDEVRNEERGKLTTGEARRLREVIGRSLEGLIRASEGSNVGLFDTAALAAGLDARTSETRGMRVYLRLMRGGTRKYRLPVSKRMALRELLVSRDSLEQLAGDARVGELEWLLAAIGVPIAHETRDYVERFVVSRMVSPPASATGGDSDERAGAPHSARVIRAGEEQKDYLRVPCSTCGAPAGVWCSPSGSKALGGDDYAELRDSVRHLSRLHDAACDSAQEERAENTRLTSALEAARADLAALKTSIMPAAVENAGRLARTNLALLKAEIAKRDEVHEQTMRHFMEPTAEMLADVLAGHRDTVRRIQAARAQGERSMQERAAQEASTFLEYELGFHTDGAPSTVADRIRALSIMAEQPAAQDPPVEREERGSASVTTYYTAAETKPIAINAAMSTPLPKDGEGRLSNVENVPKTDTLAALLHRVALLFRPFGVTEATARDWTVRDDVLTLARGWSSDEVEEVLCFLRGVSDGPATVPYQVERLPGVRDAIVSIRDGKNSKDGDA